MDYDTCTCPTVWNGVIPPPKCAWCEARSRMPAVPLLPMWLEPDPFVPFVPPPALVDLITEL